MTLTNAYRALGDPTRRQILRLLREGEAPAGQLAAQFEMSWPSVSRHLKLLQDAGLVGSERRGGSIVYSLRTSVLQDIVTELADMAGLGRPASAPQPRGRSRAREVEES